MVLRWLLVYVVVELAAVIALTWAIGLGWTVLLLAATFMIGIALAGSQVKRHVRRLQAGFDRPHIAVTDSVLVALGTVLAVVPGVVTTVLGLLLLLPPARALARPVLTVLAARHAPLLTAAGTEWARRRDYIDGEVIDVNIDVTDVEPPALPRHPD